MSDNALNIIEALKLKNDDEAIDVLRDVGTNSSREDVREKTVEALISKNSDKALRVLVANEGKGINDLSTKVAFSTIAQLVSLQDKTELIKILDETINDNVPDEVKITARSLKTLITLSE